MTSQNLIRLKLLAAFVALGCGIGAVVTVYDLYQVTPPAVSVPPASPAPAAAAAAPVASTPSAPRFPSPPPGALVLGREDRDLAVGLAVSSHGSRFGLQASILGQEAPAEKLDVAFHVPGHAPVAGDICGPGCYRAQVPATPVPRAVSVAIRGWGRAPSSVSFRLPELPAPAAVALVRKADRTWRGLKTLVVRDYLASGPGHAITTQWQFASPDRQTYSVRNGPQAVVIGPRRWDRLPGQGWQASSQDPIHTPVPLWESVSDAHLLGTTNLRGRPVWKLSFFDPQIQAWFTIWVDRQTARTLELRMTAQAHFMHQVYGPFDRPLRIVPPTKGTA